ncbi:MAG: hypothetical protein WC728_03090 [Elusimicrobiota bacterium]
MRSRSLTILLAFLTPVVSLAGGVQVRVQAVPAGAGAALGVVGAGLAAPGLRGGDPLQLSLGPNPLPLPTSVVPTVSPVIQASPRAALETAAARPVSRDARDIPEVRGIPVANVPAGLRRTFDGPTAADGAAFPKRPSGIVSVSVDLIRTPADVGRLIPLNSNSQNLIAMLRQAVRKHGELTVLTYRDPLGERFVGLDLSREPAWLDHIPELQSHELDLIRKIIRRSRDVQVLVREEGKTPDLIVNGVVTEIKSVFKDGSMERLVEKANRQVDAFNHRHLITGGGDVAVDMRGESSVPVDTVLRTLDSFAARTRTVALERVWVFGGDDLKVFERGADDRFRLRPPEARTDPGGYAKPLDAGKLRRAQILVEKGLFRPAQDVLSQIERESGPGPALEVKAQLAGRRLLLRIRKLVRKKRESEHAARLWQQFKLSHSEETVGEIEDEVLRALGQAKSAATTELSRL